jgi:hypothetical protein
MSTVGVTVLYLQETAQDYKAAFTPSTTGPINIREILEKVLYEHYRFNVSHCPYVGKVTQLGQK